MAKQSALGANLYLGVYDLSGDVGVIDNISSPRGTLDVTAIDKSAMERILGLRDGKLGFTGFWNTTAGQIFTALSAMPTTDLLASVGIPSSGALAVGDVGCGINGKQISFDPTRGQDVSLAVSTEIQSNGSALEWGQLLTAGKASVVTGTVNGTNVDNGAATAFGGAAYLHVFSMASGTMGVKLQDSPDNSAWSDLAGGAFASVTGAVSERIVLGTSAAVARHVRLVTTGTHATAVMAVLFVRHLTSQAV
jgi:hypothetical protein